LFTLFALLAGLGALLAGAALHAGSAHASTFGGPALKVSFSTDPEYSPLFCPPAGGDFPCALFNKLPPSEPFKVGFADIFIAEESGAIARSRLLHGRGLNGTIDVVDDWDLGALEKGFNRIDLGDGGPTIPTGEYAGIALGVSNGAAPVFGGLGTGSPADEFFGIAGYPGPGVHPILPGDGGLVATRFAHAYDAIVDAKKKQKVNKLKIDWTAQGPPTALDPLDLGEIKVTGVTNLIGSKKGGAYLAGSKKKNKGTKYKLKKTTEDVGPGESATTKLKFKKKHKKVVKRIKKSFKKDKKAKKKAKLTVKVKVSGPDGSSTTKQKIKLK
ncbi:MAG: hypothetical protein ACR2N5_02655, partial [Solirubrobacterales bacterium]